MAKYRGLFKVSGNVGGVNMYEMDGKTFMRDQTSLDKERLMTDPRFQRNRENMAEFGGAGKVSKSVRRGLVSVAK